MCKRFLRKLQMPDADISRAQFFADDLLRWETRGPGDTANAMRRVSQRAALPFSKLWALRYRPPKAIASHVLAALEAAHAREVERQLRKLAHDVEITARVAGPSDPALAAAAAALRAAEGTPSVVATTPLGSNRRQDRQRVPGLTDLPLWQAAHQEK